MGRPAKRLKLDTCLDILSDEFEKFPDQRAFWEIPLHDFLMSGFAVFSLKHPSLLSFEDSVEDENMRENLRRLFRVSQVPSDTHLRDVLDQINYRYFRTAFKKLFATAQRTKLFESYEFMRINKTPHYLFCSDGTGYFRSDKVGCLNCNNYKGSEKRKLKKFGHNMLGSALVHPDKKEVIPLCPEPIIVQDGKNKNDCELNAFKRFVPNLRREHPKIGIIMSLDALFATEPPIKLMFEHDISFITAVKETNDSIFRQVNDGEKTGVTKHHEYGYEIGDKVKKQVIHRYRYAKNLHLNQDPRSTRVNFVEFWEEINWEGKRGPETKKVHFSWVTDLDVNEETIVTIMKGGRARWKIENETFNTLKNQGYNLEHNYGHGKNNLSVNFVMLMFLAFLVDQLQQASCQKFKKALSTQSSKSRLWGKIVSQLERFIFRSWDEFFQIINREAKIKSEIILDTS